MNYRPFPLGGRLCFLFLVAAAGFAGCADHVNIQPPADEVADANVASPDGQPPTASQPPDAQAGDAGPAAGKGPKQADGATAPPQRVTVQRPTLPPETPGAGQDTQPQGDRPNGDSPDVEKSDATQTGDDVQASSHDSAAATDDTPRSVLVDKPIEHVVAKPAIDDPEEKPAAKDDEEEPIFVDWKKPTVALMFSGEQDGFIEPCGCAGLENQKGGLMRRFTLVKQLREQGWPLAALDVGGQTRRFGPQAEIKFRHAIESLVEIGYGAVALGAADLRHGDELFGVCANLTTNPFVSANVSLVDGAFSKRFTVIEVGGVKIGVTSVLGASRARGVGDGELIKVVKPEPVLAEVLKQLQAQEPHYLVLLSHASAEESQAFGQKFPAFDFVVTAGGAEEPPSRLERIKGTKAKLVEVGHKGMYVSVVGIYEQGNQFSVKYQRVPLDARFEDASEMHDRLTAYQKELMTLGLSGLGIRPSRHPRKDREFAGTAACAECHTEAMDVFVDTPHSHATERLVNLKPQRHFDPECLSCHATGWNPQKYFPYKSGFLGMKKTPQLGGNGCENCHGPGSAHVAAERAFDQGGGIKQEDLLALREELKLKVVENEGNKSGQVYGKVVKMCMECHDQDNSPDFDFQNDYWPRVEHYGKE